jgi:hypothetical protein
MLYLALDPGLPSISGSEIQLPHLYNGPVMEDHHKVFNEMHLNLPLYCVVEDSLV